MKETPRLSQAPRSVLFHLRERALQLLLLFTCEPVRMMGLPRFSHMKERAEAVYAMVSVPCRITNPS